MTINLSKGETIELSKAAPGLKKVYAGAGWDMKAVGPTVDVDLCAFLVDANGKLTADSNLVFFNNKKDPSGSVASRGDNLTGAGDGDDEVIDVNLESVPAGVQKIIFAVSIYEAEKKSQSLKSLDNAYVRVVNTDGDVELARYNLTNFDNASANFILGELVRNGSEWNFTAVGEPKDGELPQLIQNYKQAA